MICIQLPDLRPLQQSASHLPVSIHCPLPTVHCAMSVNRVCTVLLGATLLSHCCLSAVIELPKDNDVSKEIKEETGLQGKQEYNITIEKELKDTSLSGEVNIEDYNKHDKNQEEKQKSSESSESNSEENDGVKKLNLDSSSSESSESEESQEDNEKKTIQKRSLDSNQGSLNTIIEGQNQTKEASSGEKNEETDSLSHSESTTNNDIDVTSTTDTSDALEEDPSESTQSTTDLTVTESTTVEITSTTEEEASPLESEAENPSPTDVENNGDGTSVTTEQSEESVPENSEEDKDQSFTEMATARANKLSEQIRKVLMHYRKEGVVVVPGQSFFPEPMSVADFDKSFSVGVINFKNMKVYGLSNFTVEHINTDVDQMQVYVLLHMKKLVILGDYSLRTFLSRSRGPFNVTLLSVDSEGVAAIETTPEGHLEAADSEMDMTTKEMLVDFKNLGSVLQSMVSTVGDALFDRIKPQILDRVNLVIRNDVNQKLKEFSVKFVNKIAPVDLAFSEGRRYVREHGYDPYNIEQHTFVVGGIVHINISEFTVQGLSRFHRAGNLSLSMDAGVIQFGVHVMTQKLTGSFTWSGAAFGIARSGKTNFTVDQLQVRAVVNQSLDLRQKPQLDDLDLHLGWVKVTMDSPMTLSMMVQGIINAFPRLIKHMIVDSLEMPLKEKIQEILNEINVEGFVDSNLPRLDNFGL